MSRGRRATVCLVLALPLLAGSLGCSSDAPAAQPVGDAAETGPQEPTAEPRDPAPVVDSATALDEYVAAERSQVPAVLEATNGMYADLTVSAVHPDTVRFDYLYAEFVDPSEGIAYFDAMVPALQELCDTQVFPRMVEAGVAEPKVLYAYYNVDGSELWTRTFEQS